MVSAACLCGKKGNRKTRKRLRQDFYESDVSLNTSWKQFVMKTYRSQLFSSLFNVTYSQPPTKKVTVMSEFYSTAALFPGVGLALFSLFSLKIVQAGGPQETCMELTTITYNLSEMYV